MCMCICVVQKTSHAIAASGRHPQSQTFKAKRSSTQPQTHALCFLISQIRLVCERTLDQGRKGDQRRSARPTALWASCAHCDLMVLQVETQEWEDYRQVGGEGVVAFSFFSVYIYIYLHVLHCVILCFYSITAHLIGAGIFLGQACHSECALLVEWTPIPISVFLSWVKATAHLLHSLRSNDIQTCGDINEPCATPSRLRMDKASWNVTVLWAVLRPRRRSSLWSFSCRGHLKLRKCTAV